MISGRLTNAAASIALCVALTTGLHAQISSRTSSGASSLFVFATWQSLTSFDSSHTLLVLWRGSERWFERGAGSSSGTGSRSFGRTTTIQTVTLGEFTFMLEFDHARNILKFLGQEISLKEANVLLVDQVDSAGGPLIAGTRWVDPPTVDRSAGQDMISEIVKRSQELFEYIKCDDVPGSSSLVRAAGSKGCGRMRP